MTQRPTDLAASFNEPESRIEAAAFARRRRPDQGATGGRATGCSLRARFAKEPRFEPPCKAPRPSTARARAANGLGGGHPAGPPCAVDLVLRTGGISRAHQRSLRSAHRKRVRASTTSPFAQELRLGSWHRRQPFGVTGWRIPNARPWLLRRSTQSLAKYG